jgi:hypothetical protein
VPISSGETKSAVAVAAEVKPITAEEEIIAAKLGMKMEFSGMQCRTQI